MVMNHPLLTAASLFLVLMVGSIASTWSQDQQFSVSKHPNLIVDNDTVIIPEGEVVNGDVTVRNGKVIIEGKVKGNVTVCVKYMASAGKVTGDIEEVNEIFEWVWFRVKETGKEVFYVFNDQNVDGEN